MSPRRSIAAVALAATLLTACGDDPPAIPVGPDGQPDPVLVLGQDLYGKNCSQCHGNAGGGGRGPRISGGRLADKFPDVADQRLIVAEGRNAMPGFGAKLTEEELDAILRYTREVL